MNYTLFLILFFVMWFGLVLLEKQDLMPQLLSGLKDYIAILATLGVGVAVKLVAKDTKKKALSDKKSIFYFK